MLFDLSIEQGRATSDVELLELAESRSVWSISVYKPVHGPLVQDQSFKQFSD